jgi:hypothetical protein
MIDDISHNRDLVSIVRVVLGWLLVRETADRRDRMDGGDYRFHFSR